MKNSFLTIILFLFLTAFASPSYSGDLKIGATAVPHAEILEFIRPDLKSQGVNLDIVVFNDYIQPHYAVAEGSLKANFFATKPYVEFFAKEHNIDLVSIADVHIEPMSLYSLKFKKIEDIKEGSTIALPNDPTGAGRALLMLDKNNVISLKDNKNLTSSILDIVKNEKNFKFTELEAAILPRSLNDVDAAVINTNFALQANLNPVDDGLIIEDKTSPFVNVIVSTSKNINDEDLKKLISTIQTDKVRQFIKDKYHGAVVPAF